MSALSQLAQAVQGLQSDAQAESEKPEPNQSLLEQLAGWITSAGECSTEEQAEGWLQSLSNWLRPE